MEVTETILSGVRIIESKLFRDERGFFQETWNASVFAHHGLNVSFVQDNHCRSIRGTLRGLHYQIRNPQGKLVHVTHGSIVDVVVDLRRKSPSFGKHFVIELNDENNLMLWIPPGFAHGFYVTSPSADVLYKVTDHHAPHHERVLKWDDPFLAIDWRLTPGKVPLLNARDNDGAGFAEIEFFED